MENLEDEAAFGDAELECGHGVLHVALGVGAPLDVEAHGEDALLVLVLVVAEDGGDPGVDEGGVGGEEGVDGVGVVEGDVVEVVGVVGEAVVHHADRRHHGGGGGGGGAERRAGLVLPR